MEEIISATKDSFEKIKHIDENGVEFWYGRELMKALEYVKWDKFIKVIDNAMTACEFSNNELSDHFLQVGKLIKTAKNAKREIKEYKLSRYACYLIVQNADPKKEAIALGQTYFAIQTRKQD